MHPPYALYYVGKLPDENRKRVAIVGARGRSAYGSQVAGKLAKRLAEANVDVISGMALGIDTDSHFGALDGKGDTYAVLGCGADVCYPKSNQRLYEKSQSAEELFQNMHYIHRHFLLIFRRETVSLQDLQIIRSS